MVQVRNFEKTARLQELVAEEIPVDEQGLSLLLEQMSDLIGGQPTSRKLNEILLFGVDSPERLGLFKLKVQELMKDNELMGGLKPLVSLEFPEIKMDGNQVAEETKIAYMKLTADISRIVSKVIADTAPVLGGADINYPYCGEERPDGIKKGEYLIDYFKRSEHPLAAKVVVYLQGRGAKGKEWGTPDMRIIVDISERLRSTDFFTKPEILGLTKPELAELTVTGTYTDTNSGAKFSKKQLAENYITRVLEAKLEQAIRNVQTLLPGEPPRDDIRDYVRREPMPKYFTNAEAAHIREVAEKYERALVNEVSKRFASAGIEPRGYFRESSAQALAF